jgi:hypothetical protein
MGNGAGGGGRYNPSRSHSHRPKGLSTYYLAHFYFPGLCWKFKLGFLNGSDATIDGGGLTFQLNRWKKAGIPLETIRSMMDEFAQHPEWSRRTTPPWQMFLRKRHQLAKLVYERQNGSQADNRDPAAWGKIWEPKV